MSKVQSDDAKEKAAPPTSTWPMSFALCCGDLKQQEGMTSCCPRVGNLCVSCSCCGTLCGPLWGPDWPCNLATWILVGIPSVLFVLFAVPYIDQKHGHGGVFSYVCYVVVGALVLSLFCTANCNSGVVTASHSARFMREHGADRMKHCQLCKIQVPRRSTHCRDCGVCVVEWDHHCPWMGQCVGGRNLWAFYTFLTLVMTVPCLMILALIIGSVINTSPASG